MKYHIHVYKVSSMKEFDIEADSEDAARQKAIDLCKHIISFEKPDCSFLALSFPEVEKEK